MPVSDLTIQIDNIKEAKGDLRVAVFNTEAGFLSPKSVYFSKILPLRQKGSVSIVVPGAPDGWYAISCFHDVNGNGVLDTNIFGIPTEPYGFSNGARPKFRAPNWQEAKVWHAAGRPAAQIKLETW